mmetsp:Transcript_21756/g.45765  ORF Transcript_21756/g.45765 Transcript_21756/m.45765 type:complete len:684 (-) Transcript_21756:103-2154(-)
MKQTIIEENGDCVGKSSVVASPSLKSSCCYTRSYFNVAPEENNAINEHPEKRQCCSIARRNRRHTSIKSSLDLRNSAITLVILIGCVFSSKIFQNESHDVQSSVGFRKKKRIFVSAFGWINPPSRALISSQGCCNRRSQKSLGGDVATPSSSILALRHPKQGRNRSYFSQNIYKPECRSFVSCWSTISSDTEIVETHKRDQDPHSLSNGDSLANGSLSAGTKGVSFSSVNQTINGSGLKHEEVNNSMDTGNAMDVPLPTVNGGYTHTSASRAKISAANKGKTPWNKGKGRSEEVRKRIAEGVRRKNRERFLAKLAAEGITEEEYEQRKKEERRKKDAERRARKTANGGYTPTEETKKKISNILKEKYATGEIKRAPRAQSAIRRGFKHSEETKQKIRESLRRKWAEDAEYREMMTNKTIANPAVNNESVRKRIAETLKKKWEDPEFRAKMMEKFSKRRTSSSRDQSHRKKISEAMKRKWMDEEYRKRATDGMAKGRESVKAVKPIKPKGAKKRSTISVAKKATPVKMTTVTTKRQKKKKKKLSTKKSTVKGGSVMAVKPLTPQSSTLKKTSSKVSSTSKVEEEFEGDGSILRLREERRDLYDLLYGDDDDDDEDVSFLMKPAINNDSGHGTNKNKGRAVMEPSLSNPVTDGGNQFTATGAMSSFLFGDDEDLDDFDPYGLDNV